MQGQSFDEDVTSSVPTPTISFNGSFILPCICLSKMLKAITPFYGNVLDLTLGLTVQPVMDGITVKKEPCQLNSAVSVMDTNVRSVTS